MPVSPDMAEDLATAVAALYEQAELALIEKVTKALAEGIDSPLWAELKLRSIGHLRTAIEDIIAALQTNATGAIHTAVAEAYSRGTQAAVVELGAIAPAVAAIPAGTKAVDRLAAALVQETSATHTRILRTGLDVYRQVIAEATSAPLLGATTRREAAARALTRFTDKGVTGFVDRAGRSWELRSYVEMASRSALGRAAVQAHTDRLGAAGVELVIISDAPEECSLCLIPGTVVEGPVPTGRTRTEYTGDVIRIVTASGKDLTGTPDHPVLTPRGWVALKHLGEGDKVISHDREKGFAGVAPDDVQVPALIEEAGKARLPVLLAGPTRRDFNQNVAYRKVRYVPANCDLPTESDPSLCEPVPEHLLVGGIGLSGSLLGLHDGELVVLGEGRPAGRGVHGVKHLGSLVGSGISPALGHPHRGHDGAFLVAERSHVIDDALVAGASRDVSALEVVTHYPTADAEGGAELLRALTGKVAADEIVSLSVGQFSGHVWDLSTGPSWYVANGIVTHNCKPWEGKILRRDGNSGAGTVETEHATEDDRMVQVKVAGSLPEARAAGLFHPNCRHSQSAYLPGVTKPSPPKEQRSRATYEQSQQQRYLERQVRAWKRRAAGSLDDAARTKANAKVRAYQGRIRELVSETGLPRKSHREQVASAR